jgi:predicted secreted hydrolase
MNTFFGTTHPTAFAVFFILFLQASPARTAEWRSALPGWKYEFPRDHRIHPEFKTEWWYFTGRLTDEKGAIFGYQLTFFRQGISPLTNRARATSRFIIDDLKFAHFALSDIGAQRFYFEQKLSRGAFGEAGFGSERLAWIDDWSLELLPDGSFVLRARNAQASMELQLTNTKPWAIHGKNGVSQKASGEGRASHYYSATRLATRGKLTVDGRARLMSGESWLDREWASNQLTPEQVGWDWFSLQFEDGTELMLYQIRTRSGDADPNSSATFVARDGTTRHLRRDAYELRPTGYWTSKATGGKYPVVWELLVPDLKLNARIKTPLKSQELALQPVVYWEGLIDVDGTREAAAIRGHGYMELTGYTGALVGLSENP